MRKILFNDKYGLTKAVLEGRKTMTRRIINTHGADEMAIWIGPYVTLYERGDVLTDIFPAYKVSEEVAVAQRYGEIPMEQLMKQRMDGNAAVWPFEILIRQSKGYTNKMFVKAELMPHRIRITNINVERLQDISEDDCLKEGIERIPHPFVKDAANVYTCHGIDGFYTHPKDCFAALIDKVSGKGTWKRNPWVFGYSFELVK